MIRSFNVVDNSDEESAKFIMEKFHKERFARKEAMIYCVRDEAHAPWGLKAFNIHHWAVTCIGVGSVSEKINYFREHNDGFDRVHVIFYMPGHFIHHEIPSSDEYSGAPFGLPFKLKSDTIRYIMRNVDTVTVFVDSIIKVES